MKNLVKILLIVSFSPVFAAGEDSELAKKKVDINDLLPKPGELPDATPPTPEENKQKKPVKNWVETNGPGEDSETKTTAKHEKKVELYSYCESAKGKQIRSDERGYEDCVRQLRQDLESKEGQVLQKKELPHVGSGATVKKTF